jgi:hypothetical protein
MYRSCLSILLISSAVLFGVTQTVGQPLCSPAISFKEVRFSEVRNQQRTWAAVLDVDASRCGSTFGRFEISFNRLKETAPDLQFAQQFTWNPGRVEVSVDFWADEAVLNYSISHVEPCTCRN